MARRIDDVHVVMLVFERGILGANGDPFLPLQIHRIHQSFLGGLRLIGAERPRLFEQTIDERRLAVIHVGDDRNVSDVQHKPFNRAGQRAQPENQMQARG